MTRNEAGTALIETVIIAFAVVAVALPVLVAAVRLSEAQSAIASEATDVAAWTARHGSPPVSPDRMEVEIRRDGRLVSVRVSTEVELVGIGTARVAMTITEQASAVVSDFRSDP